MILRYIIINSNNIRQNVREAGSCLCAIPISHRCGFRFVRSISRPESFPECRPKQNGLPDNFPAARSHRLCLADFSFQLFQRNGVDAKVGQAIHDEKRIASNEAFVRILEFDIADFRQVFEHFARFGIHTGETHFRGISETHEHASVVCEADSAGCLLESQLMCDAQPSGHQQTPVQAHDFPGSADHGIYSSLGVACKCIVFRAAPFGTCCERRNVARMLGCHQMLRHGIHGIQYAIYHPVCDGHAESTSRGRQEIQAFIRLGIEHVDAAAGSGQIDFIV